MKTRLLTAVNLCISITYFIIHNTPGAGGWLAHECAYLRTRWKRVHLKRFVVHSQYWWWSCISFWPDRPLTVPHRQRRTIYNKKWHNYRSSTTTEEYVPRWIVFVGGLNIFRRSVVLCKKKGGQYSIIIRLRIKLNTDHNYEFTLLIASHAHNFYSRFGRSGSWEGNHRHGLCHFGYSSSEW